MIVIRNRKMVIPYEDVYIGTSYDTNTEIRMFKVQRYTSNHKDLAALNFRLDLRYNITDQNAADTVMLSKEVHDDYILLKWEITESVLQAPGTAFINLRATENGTNRWSTFIAAVYIGHTLYTPGSYTGSLTEIEQMEADFDHFKRVIEDLEPLVNLTDTAEAWAVGQRNGHDVSSSDITYHNNAKYYSGTAMYAAADSENFRNLSQAYAEGKIGSQDVDSDDPAYHNNAKYYRDNAATSANQSVAMAETAEAWAEGEINDVPVDSSHPAYHNNAKYYAGQASYHSNAALTFSGNANDFSIAAAASASAAANSAENAAASEDNAESYASAAQASDASAATAASNSEAWAVGQRNGTNVGSSDSAYHNNAKYYAEQADASSNLAGVHKDAAQTAAQQAAASATSAAGSALDASDYADQAAASATAAAASAASLTVDTALSDTSTNPVQNKVITGEITDVKTAINKFQIRSESIKVDNYGQGYIDPATGVNAPTTYWCRTLGYRYYGSADFLDVTTNSAYKGYIIEYTSEDATGYVRSFDLNTGGTVQIPLSVGHCYRMTIAQINDQPFAPSDIIQNAVTYITAKCTDKSLTLDGKAADAKTIGDILHVTNTVVPTWQNKTINGTTGAETANSKRLSTVEFIPFEGYDFAVTAQSGYRYSFRIYSSPVSSSIIGTTDWMTGTNSPTLTDGQYFKIVASNTTDTNVDVSEGSNISVQFISCTDRSLTYQNKSADAKETGDRLNIIENEIGNNIIARNDKYNTVLKMQQLTMIPRTVSSTYGTKPLCLLHFSDLHNDQPTLQNIVDYAHEYSEYIDDILHTGDTVFYRASDGMSAWENVYGAENILNTIGNHDTRVGDTWIGLTEAESYATYIEPYMGNWGATVTENHCYYYKDYTTENVRLIVTDYMHQTAEQLTWFQQTLSSALTAGLHVLVATHSRSHWLFNPYDVPWDDRPVVKSYKDGWIDHSSDAYPENLSNDYADAVDTFIDNGGYFIAWIHGHTHFKMFAKLQTHQNQLDVAVANAGMGEYAKTYVNARVAGTKSEDSFNVLAIDTTSKVIRIMAVGATYDRFMRYVDTISYNYETHELLYSND